MKCYQELTIIKSPNISPNFIWSRLYLQLHLALVEIQEKSAVYTIGVSFPDYRYLEKDGKTEMTLGHKLRIFARSREELKLLNLNHWLSRLMDYILIQDIADIPTEITQYLVVKRLRKKANNDNLTRNYARKHQMSFAEAKEKRIERFSDLHKVTREESLQHYDNPIVKRRPFIVMQSLGNKQTYSLEIEQIPVSNAQEGVFSTYGLSSQTTVPNW